MINQSDSRFKGGRKFVTGFPFEFQVSSQGLPKFGEFRTDVGRTVNQNSELADIEEVSSEAAGLR